VYGGQIETLMLEPVSGGEPGQYKADFTPARPGQYTLKITGHLAGSLGDTAVDVEVEPEEVFPGTATAPETVTPTTSLPWIVIGGLVAAVAAFAVWFFAMRGRK
jgi:hypothetical protein